MLCRPMIARGQVRLSGRPQQVLPPLPPVPLQVCDFGLSKQKQQTYVTGGRLGLGGLFMGDPRLGAGALPTARCAAHAT